MDAIEQMKVEEERRITARLLHDCLCTDLTNLSLAAEIALRTFDVDPAKVKEALFRVRGAAIACNSAMRYARRIRRYDPAWKGADASGRNAGFRHWAFVDRHVSDLPPE